MGKYDPVHRSWYASQPPAVRARLRSRAMIVVGAI